MVDAAAVMVEAGGVSAAAGPGSCGAVGRAGTAFASSPGVRQPIMSKCGRLPCPNFIFIGRSARLTTGMQRVPRNARMVMTASFRTSKAMCAPLVAAA